MALGLNSTLSITEGNKKLPPCPILLLSNSEGLLQVYYFIHKTLPPICRTPEVIKESQPLQLLNKGILQTSSSKASPLNLLQSFIPSSSSTNGFSFSNFGFTPQPPPTTTSANIPQPKEKNISSIISFDQQPLQTTNNPSIDDVSKSMSRNIFNQQTSVQQSPTKITTNHQQSSSSLSNNKKLLQMINEFQSKLESLEKPLSKSSESSINLDKSLENLTTTLNNMTTTFQTNTQSIKSMTSEHMESMTKIENALQQIKLSQKENLYHLLKDRELDPWTQSRLDSIKTKYDQLKHDFNVLLQLTHTTIHDKSLPINDDETENEDFLPDLEISLNTNETMRQRIQKRICELSHKVSETEKDLQNICTKLNTDLLSGSTFTKTTMSSNRTFHSLDAQILSHLQATHPNVLQIHVPPAAVINLSPTIEQKKQSTIEITNPITPSIQPSTPKQANSPTIDSESFKNMLRIVRTSIDLFSGITSPEQLQELSNTIATSPLSSTQKSNVTSISKTPTISKTTNLSKAPNITKPLNTTITPTNILQTPAKSVTSPIPTISVTPATPATQTITSDAALKLQQNKPIVQTATDLSKSQTISITGDSAIRSLLNNTSSSPTTMTLISNQPIITSTTNQVIKPPLFGSPPSTSAPQVISQASLPTVTTTTVPPPIISTPSSTQSPFGIISSPTSTITTSVQSTSPTTKPLMSTGFSAFGSRPTFGGTAFNLTPTTSAGMPFGNTAATTSTGSLFGSAATTTTSTPSPFPGGFGTSTTTATTSAPSTSSFGASTSPASSPFGSGFGTSATTVATTPAPTTGIFGAATAPTSSLFGSGFGTVTTAAATSAPSTSPFGSGFGNSTTATSPFGGSFSTATSTPTISPFGGGSGFGAASSAPTGTTFGGFSTASTAPTSTSNTSVFGGSGFGFNSTLPATSAATSTPGTSLFSSGGSGGGTSTFGSGFSGFGTHSSASGSSTSFSFGGFGSQPSEATAPHSGFGSFGSPPAASQSSSPFGGSVFGGASGQSTGFGTTTSSFGAPSTQPTNSPSFTAYRK